MTKGKLQHQKSELKRFIREFNFPHPSWEEVPSDFPNISSYGLTKAEKGMLSGIMLAWYLEKGKHVIYKRCIKVGFTITFIITLGLYGRFITSPNGIAVVKNVSAATVSATMKLLNVDEDNDQPLYNVKSEINLDDLDPESFKKDSLENTQVKESVDEFIESTMSAIKKSNK